MSHIHIDPITEFESSFDNIELIENTIANLQYDLDEMYVMTKTWRVAEFAKEDSIQNQISKLVNLKLQMYEDLNADDYNEINGQY